MQVCTAESFLACACTTRWGTLMFPSISGYHRHTPKDYTIKGGKISQLFGIFNAFAVIALTYGNAIIPEIQVWSCIMRTCCCCMYDGFNKQQANMWSFILEASCYYNIAFDGFVRRAASNGVFWVCILYMSLELGNHSSPSFREDV
jgi:hypothetical protein